MFEPFMSAKTLQRRRAENEEVCDVCEIGGYSMNPIDYRGESFRYDRASNSYYRPRVKVKFPCSRCGSPRPENVIVDPKSGGVRIEIGKCCSSKETEGNNLRAVVSSKISTED